LTHRQLDRPTKVVGGLFFVALIGLFMLLAWGYHTLLLILVGVMGVISVFTVSYARRATLEGLALIAGVGLFSLLVQGYLTLVLVIAGIIFISGALAFLYYDGQYLWSWWFPDQPFNPTIKRWLRYLVQAMTAGVAYGVARVDINRVTGVDPGNFPTALTALTALITVVLWFAVLPLILELMAFIYMGVASLAGLRGSVGPKEIGGISAGRWGFRAFGAISLMIVGLALYLTLVMHPWTQRVGRLIATNMLVATEFSYDRTCAVSTEQRLVAQLKDRKERPVSLVSIAEEGSRVWGPFRHFTFSTGTCADQRES
jgi:hypothetical protein